MKGLPPFNFQLPPNNPTACFSGLLKLNGLRGGKRDTDTVVTLPAVVIAGKFYLRKTRDLYTFCIIFCNICIVLFFRTLGLIH